MKRLLTIIIGLFLLLSVEGQILRYSNYTAPIPPEGPSGDFNVEYDTIVAAFTYTIPDSIKTKQNIIVDSLVYHEIWGKLDLVYVFGTTNATDALINWIDPGTFDATNSNCTFTAYEGFTGSIENSGYLATSYNVSSDNTYVSATSVSTGAYLRIEEDDAAVHAIWGATDGAYQLTTVVKYSGNTSIRVWSDIPSSLVSSTSKGFFVVSLLSGTCTAYRNAASLGEVNTRDIVPNSTLNLLRRPTNTSYSANQISFFFAGSGLTSSEIIIINRLIERYMDSNGKGVQ